MRRLATVFALVLVAAAGCVTTQEEGSGPEACVVVDNTEGAGAQSRLFLVSESSGWRLGMGQVGMGGVLEFCTRRIRGAEDVFILIEQPATGQRNASLIWTDAGYIRTRTFTIHLDDVWTWDIDRNQLSRAVRY